MDESKLYDMLMTIMQKLAVLEAKIDSIEEIKIDAKVVSNRVDKLEAISAATNSAVQTIVISGITGVSATKTGTEYTIDFANMVIDAGEF